MISTGQTGSMFRFQTLEIWKKAVQIGEMLFDIADDLEERKLFRFAEQLRGAGLSISNNVAEGSGSLSKRDFAHFLNIAKRSTFENANMVMVFAKRGLIERDKQHLILDELEQECKMITGFIANLRRAPNP